MDIRRRHTHEPPATSDGYSVLIGRLWPRGVPKTDAEIDEWAHKATLHELRRRARKGRLTLVYSAGDEEHDDAVVPPDLRRRGGRSV